MSAQREIIGVQYLRGLAAVAVVVDHAAGTLSQTKYLGYHLFGGALESGRIGADLFFLISGFIIAAVSLQGPELEPAIDRRSFFLRRFARVIPVMWVAILTHALMSGVGVGMRVHHFDDYLRAFFLVPYGEVKPQTIWTLRQELIFYLVFAFSMLGARQWRWLMVAWVLAPAVMWLPRGLFEPRSIPFEFLRIVFHPVAFEFGAGMLLAILWFKRTDKLVIRLPFEPLVALVLAFCFPLAVTVWSEWVLGYRPSALVMALCCAPVLFLGIHLYCPAGPGQRIGRMLGDASYAIYLFHVHVLSVVLAVWMKLAPATPGVFIVGGSVAAAVAVGILLHHIVERPLVRAARRRFDRRPISVESSPATPAPPEPANPDPVR